MRGCGVRGPARRKARAATRGYPYVDHGAEGGGRDGGKGGRDESRPCGNRCAQTGGGAAAGTGAMNRAPYEICAQGLRPLSREREGAALSCYRERGQASVTSRG